MRGPRRNELKNPKTTIAGYLVLLGSISTIAAHVMIGQGLSVQDLTALVTALAGVGLVLSSDGGH